MNTDSSTESIRVHPWLTPFLVSCFPLFESFPCIVFPFDASFQPMNPFLFRPASWSLLAAIACSPVFAADSAAPAKASDAATVKAEHSDIGLSDDGKTTRSPHTAHPDAQWFPDAGFGLFIHWGIASVRAMNISWPMIPGRALANTHITDPAERERIVREGDFNLTGKPNGITPNEYFAMAKEFNPQSYDPDKWIKAAKDAGFAYVVLTTRHHEGFALWPSAYGDFDTKNYMGGRDLLKPYVDACRKYGLKVGFYYSPPDWYFDRDFMNFIYGRGAKNNPELPPVGPDLKPRTTTHTPEEIAAHEAAFAEKVNGQIEELLTRYGKIDLLWFDGKPNIRNVDSKVITPERIRKLQPGIVINPRLHGIGKGDYVTFERTLPAKRPELDWAEFCNTWTSSWSHQDLPFRSNAFVLGQLAQSRAWGINYLLGVGPMASGEMTPGVYENMAVVSEWMKHNGVSVLSGAKPLPKEESATVPATARGKVRYLFAIPKFKKEGKNLPEDQLPPVDESLEIKGVEIPKSVTMLATGQPVEFTYDAADKTVSVDLRAEERTKLVDVIAVELP
jgi:alpha-L-fucosidase